MEHSLSAVKVSSLYPDGHGGQPAYGEEGGRLVFEQLKSFLSQDVIDLLASALPPVLILLGLAFAALWEDRAYDRPMQKQFDTVIRLLRESLKEHGIEEIFSMKSGIASTETAADRILFLATFRVHRLLTAKKVPDIQVGMIPTIWKILPYRSL